jgi:hypothetical protein
MRDLLLELGKPRDPSNGAVGYALVTLGVLVALANPVRGTILGFVSIVLVAFAFVSGLPIIPIALTVLYQELRRAEGSDLEHLAKLTGDAA